MRELRAPNWSRDGHGAFQGTRTPEGPAPDRWSGYNLSTMLSTRYRTTAPFSAGILATIMERPADCECTWVPDLAYFRTFSLKYPSGNCRHHWRFVNGTSR